MLSAGINVVIPPKKNRKEQREYDRYLYKIRHLVENAFLWLKRWRGIATRYAKKVLSRVMRKYNSVTYEVGSAKAEQAAGMFGLAAGQRAASCPSRVAKPLAKPLTGGWRSASYARSQQSAPCFSRSICSSDFRLM